MTAQRLDVRLDPERSMKLSYIVATRQAPVSEIIRSLIDEAFEEMVTERNRLAVERLCQMEVEEDMPDPEELSRQLESTYDIPDLYGDEHGLR